MVIVILIPAFFAGFAATVSSKGRQQRDQLPSMPPIDAEVPVNGEYLAVVDQFRHPHKARIGEAHRQILVLSGEPSQVGPVIMRGKSVFNFTALDCFEEWLGGKAVIL